MQGIFPFFQISPICNSEFGIDGADIPSKVDFYIHRGMSLQIFFVAVYSIKHIAAWVVSL